LAETPKKKKVVKVESTSAPATKSTGDGSSSSSTWKPTEAAKSQATRNRIIALILWAVAIAIEVVAIFWLLPKISVTSWGFWALIGALVVMGILSIVGSLLWKKANKLDPASNKDKVRFFIQNQLGVIIAVIAFLPLIILIFANKDLDQKQKGILGGIAIVIALIAGYFGIEFNSASVEAYSYDQNVIVQLKGEDNVSWVAGGQVYHVCSAVPDVNRESADGQIYEGTIATAQESGKYRLTLKWESQAVNYCGFTQEQVDAVKATVGDRPAQEAPEE